LAISKLTMHQSKSLQLGRVEAIDALRGLAAVSVLLFHAREILWIGGSETLRRHGFSFDPFVLVSYLTLPFRYGYLGVTLFFVLSGYCIHRRGALQLARSKDSKLDIKTFAKRRLFRIYPTYAAALILTFVLDLFLTGRPGMAAFGKQDHSWTTMIYSLLSLQGYVSPSFGSNYVFWTLAMEIHLYAAYPLLYYISSRLGARAALATAFICGIGFIFLDGLFGIESKLPYRLVRGPVFLPYWFTWAIGFYLAEVEAGRAKKPSVGCFYCCCPGRNCGWIALNCFQARSGRRIMLGPGLWRFCILESVQQWQPGLGRFLGRPLAFIGVFSYSLYATHVPLLYLFRSIFSNSGTKFPTIVPVFAGIFSTLLLSWVFFQLIERWTLRWPPGRDWRWGEGRGRRTAVRDRGRKTEDGGRKAVDGGRKPECRRERSEVGDVG